MGILSWIIFGAIAGWAASKITNAKDQGCITNIILGIVGAFVGGFLFSFITGGSINIGFSLSGFAVAVVGSIIVLAIASAVRK